MQVRLVPAPGNTTKRLPDRQLVGRLAVPHRDHRVVVTPDDEHARALHEMQLVEGGDPLARRAHDAAQGWRGRRPGDPPRPARRRFRARAGSAHVRRHADAAQLVAEPAGPRERALVDGPLDGQLRSGERGRPESRERLLARPPLDSRIRAATRSGNWYANCIETPPPREWPTRCAARDAELVEQVAQRARHRTQAVVARAPDDSPWPGRSTARTRIPCADRRSGMSPQVSELDPIPWMSRTGVPVPGSSRKAGRARSGARAAGRAGGRSRARSSVPPGGAWPVTTLP